MSEKPSDLPRFHPSIDLNSISSIQIYGKPRIAAEVTCPNCGQKRWRPLTALREELLKAFTGWCKSCNSSRQSRPRRLDLPLSHPAVDCEHLESRFIYGHKVMAAKVTCPHCHSERWYPLSILRQQLKRQNFNGQCKPCGQRESRAGYYQWAKRKNGGRRNLATNGYVTLGPTYVQPTDLPIFRQMQKRGGFVLEHRFVIAKHLQRALRSDECVDHMNGERTDNRLENLRIYVRGKNQPGSIGHGTYYHEWQMAEAEILKLKEKLKGIGF